MMDSLYIGETPPDEPCAQYGTPDYYDRARKECRAYIEALRKKLGPEPDGAKLRILSEHHSNGPTLAVVCDYDEEGAEAFDYALKCESEGPLTWAEVGMTAP